MSAFSLVQFEDQEGTKISEVLQVPNSIDVAQLRSLINTSLDLFINGNLITETLEASLTTPQIQNVEEIKKITLVQDSPSSKPAVYCSSTYSGHEGPVLCTRITDKVVLTSGGDRTVRFWDKMTKTQFMIVQKHTHWAMCLDHSENFVVSGGMDGLVNIYDHNGNHIRTLTKHKDGVTGIKIDREKIVSCSRDSTCIVWGIDGAIKATWNHSKPIKSLSVMGDLIITGASDGSIRVYKSLKHHCDLTGHKAQVNCIVSMGRYVISGDDTGQVIVWKDLQLFKRLQHKREVISLCFSPNGMSFASGSFDKTVKLWNLETGECLNTYFHVNLVYKVRVYNDLVISCSKDRTVKMFKISKNKVISEFVCEDEIYDFDYNEGMLMCGCKNGKVYFFN